MGKHLAVFRADASVAIGGGHIMRCLTLAHALLDTGWTCAFAVNAEGRAFLDGWRSENVKVIEVCGASGEDHSLLHRHWPGGCQLLVIDHYGLDATYEKACRPWADKIVAIDDLADRPHDCDILLDQNLGRRPENYFGLVPEKCRVITGPEFALLRPQFAAVRARSLARRRHNSDIARILVSLGASDPHNVTQIVLEGIAQSGLQAAVDVVLGIASPYIGSLRAFSLTMPQIVEFHVGVHDMATLMEQADLGIGAGGTTSWERCCLGLPSLIVIAADNQSHNVEELLKAGAVKVLGRREAMTLDRIADVVGDLAANGNEIIKMSEHASRICDGRGVLNVLCSLLPAVNAADGKPVALRIASAADTGIMFNWQSDMRTRRYAREAKLPTKMEHEVWTTTSLNDPDRVLCLVSHDNQPAGVLRFDCLPERNNYEVSILVDPDKYGQGIAAAALALGRNLFPGMRLVAEVLPGNKASHKLFLRAGYRAVNASHYVNEPRAQM